MDTQTIADTAQLDLFPKPLPPLVALWSPAPQSGKSTAALGLADMGFVKIAFADTLKQMLVVLFHGLGMTYAEIDERLYGSRKGEVIPALGQAARDLMVSLGTKWGREMVDPELWVMATMPKVADFRAKGNPVVIDDMRTPNELAAVWEAGGKTIGVRRPGVETSAGAAALEGLLSFGDMDAVAVNDGSARSLEYLVQGIVEGLR